MTPLEYLETEIGNLYNLTKSVYQDGGEIRARIDSWRLYLDGYRAASRHIDKKRSIESIIHDAIIEITGLHGGDFRRQASDVAEEIMKELESWRNHE